MTTLKETREKLLQEPFVKELTKKYGNESVNYTNIYLVGGCVRDFVIGKESKDIDIIIPSVPFDDLVSILEKHGKVNLVGKSFAVIKFKPTGWDEDLDIAIPRKEIKTGKGHKDFKIVGDHNMPIIEDLKRRDFTFNSMVMTLDGKIIDPFNGLIHIKENKIEAVNEKAFIEDPLRMLRALQFAARFKMELSDFVLKSIIKYSNLIHEISGERIYEEFEKVESKNGDFNILLKYLESTNLLEEIFRIKKIGHKVKIQNSFDFYYTVLKHKGNEAESFFKETLKGTSEKAKAIKTVINMIDEFYLIEDNTLFKIRKLIFKFYKQSNLLFNFTILPIEIRTELDVMLNTLILETKELKISGKQIMELLDLNPGKVIDEIQSKLVDVVLSECIKNNFEDLSMFIQLNKTLWKS